MVKGRAKEERGETLTLPITLCALLGRTCDPNTHPVGSLNAFMWVTSSQSQHEDKGRNVGASGAVENNNKVFLVIIEHESDKCATLSGF